MLTLCLVGCSAGNSKTNESDEIIEANFVVQSDSIQSMTINNKGTAHIVASNAMFYCVDKQTQEAIEYAMVNKTNIELIATKTKANLPKLKLK